MPPLQSLHNASILKFLLCCLVGWSNISPTRSARIGESKEGETSWLGPELHHRNGSTTKRTRGGSPLREEDKQQSTWPLPTSCGLDGVIALVAGRTYSTCPASHPDCEDNSGDRFFINTSCHTLQGAAGVVIHVSGSIVFRSQVAVQIIGPMEVTMTESAGSLVSAAIESYNSDLHVVARSPQSVVRFHNIRTEDSGGALFAYKGLVLEGSGSIVFENVHSKKSGGAAYSVTSTRVAVAGLQARNCTSQWSGGVLIGTEDIVFENSSRTVLIEDCQAGDSGGAVHTSGSVLLSGHNANYSFHRCVSLGDDDEVAGGGGAISARGDVTVDVGSEGVASFAKCHSHGQGQEAGGGAVKAFGSIAVHSGTVMFEACIAQSSKGHALYALYGNIEIDTDTNVTVLRDQQHHDTATGSEPLGAEMSSAGAVVPASSTLVLSRESLATLKPLLASKAFSQGATVCPAGSSFSLYDSGLPVPDRCAMCSPGSVSLAPTRMHYNETAVPPPDAGMRLILVRKGSPMAIRNFVAWAWSSSNASEAASAAAANSTLARSSWNAVGPSLPTTLFGSVSLVPRSAASSYMLTVEQQLVANGRGLTVPNSKYAVGSKLRAVPGKHQFVDMWGGEACQQWVVDETDGTVSPLKAHWLSIGYSHEVDVAFDPRSPLDACVPCHRVAPSMQEQLQCKGGSHLSSLPGYMVIVSPALAENSSSVQVHRCPNRNACPGSNLSFTAEGDLTPESQHCSEGYRHTGRPGCASCSKGYGRPQLDPFVCQPCGGTSDSASSITKWAPVAPVVLSSTVLYVLALRSARPRSEAQQLFKLLLSFMTISCRSLAAVPHTEFYPRLRDDLLSQAHATYRVLFAADLVFSAEPGGGASSSLDCWPWMADGGPVSLYGNLLITISTPLALLILALIWKHQKLNECLKALLVWSAVFLAPIAGAAAKFLPCYSTANNGDQKYVMYAMREETPCTSGLGELLASQHFHVSCLVFIFVLLVGPALWLAMILPTGRHSHQGGERGSQPDSRPANEDAAVDTHDSLEQTVDFLVAGYKPWCRWWEMTVLGRKIGIFLIATFFPMSWSPGAHLAYLLCLILLAELLHVTAQPYTNDHLNRLEAQALVIAAASLVLVLSLLVRWPFMPYEAYVVSIALLGLLTTGAYIYFLVLYCRATFRGSAFCATSDQEEQDKQRQTKASGGRSEAEEDRGLSPTSTSVSEKQEQERHWQGRASFPQHWAMEAEVAHVETAEAPAVGSTF